MLLCLLCVGVQMYFWLRTLMCITNSTLIFTIWKVVCKNCYAGCKYCKLLFDPSWLHKYSPSSQMINIPLAERQGLKYDYIYQGP